jgi:hypothetical protein
VHIPYQANHSLRKWFKTRCEIGGMKPINIEKLMNHSVGISNSYYRTTENEVLEDYVKAIDSLSINDDKLTLQKQMVELTEKNKEENYIIKGKLFEREKEIHTMQQKYEQDMKDLRKELEPLQVLKKTLEEQGILKASDN